MNVNFKPSVTRFRCFILSGAFLSVAFVFVIVFFNACLTPKPMGSSAKEPPRASQTVSQMDSTAGRPGSVSVNTTPAQRKQPAIKSALRSRDPELEIITEGGKTYGVYRLKRGEALYTSVVVRFTSRIDAEEVRQITNEIMRLNGIQDETAIPEGQEIRIPIELIDESYFQDEPAPEPPRSDDRSSQSLHVILDAGHGGNDPGTIVRGWREDAIAYDIMHRLQKGLERKGVKVYPIVSSNDKQTRSDNGAYRHRFVNVTPPYFLEDSRVGVNLRIYLIDSIYRRLIDRGVAPEDIIFISIHLDHLHSSVRGAMVYIPGAEERINTYKVSDAVYHHYEESRRQSIEFERRNNYLAERASRSFAKDLIASFQKSRLPIHSYKPIRRFVYRAGRKWTPGIIRYSRVPTSVLLEVANLSNPYDLKRARTTTFRQKVADSVVRAILSRRS